MKHLYRAFVSVVLAAASVATVQAAADMVKAAARPRPTAPRGASYRQGEVIVQFRESAARDRGVVERALREGRAERARSGVALGSYLASLQAGDDVAAAVSRFRAMPEVEFAEPNGIVRKTQSTTFAPNDKFFEFQWNLKLIGAERTWAIQKGKPEVVVAVLDTGIAYEDFGPYRKAPDFGGTVFVPGYDFVNDDAHANDDEYHGTHVASTVAEATNNSLGVAGFAFGCALMPVKVLDANGDGTFFDVSQGIDFAANFQQGGKNPVKVINMSLGGDGPSQAVSRAVDNAFARGIVIVASAGNDNEGKIAFPASLANVIAVGAVDGRKSRAPYSNFGKELSVVAPGGDCDRDDDHDGAPDCVFQQMPDPDGLDVGRHDLFCYCGLDGTSMAAPHVSGLAALLISQGITDPKAVRAAIEQNAEPLGGAAAGGRNDNFGHGLIRPEPALSGLGLNSGPQK
jgi:serine protease